MAVALALSMSGCAATSGIENIKLPHEASPQGLASDGFARPAMSAAQTSALRPQSVGALAAQSKSADSDVRAATAAGTPGSEGYRVGPLDVLDVTVFKLAELSKTVQVSESGRFGFPLIGEVQGSGRTVSEIEKDLASRLGEQYLRNPQVTVLVKEYNSHRITVEGAVKKAGVFPMQGPMSLMQAVATAGGLDESSDGSLLIFRRVDGQSAVARFNLDDLRNQQAEDPTLQAGDIVMVPSSGLKQGLQYFLRAAPLLNAFVLL
ncbi:MAG: polysaccharide biosynthesis/export family protein [Hyphomicrobiaceae bacterium]